MRRAMAAAAFAVLLGTFGAQAAGAQGTGPEGTWLTESGETRVRISSCAAGLCGNIVWLKTPSPNAKVGTRLVTMAKDGANSWSGELFNYKDGKTYKGKLAVQDKSHLKLSGCVLGGLICRSQVWTRAK